MSNITIGALALPGFNSTALGADIALSGLTVALADDQVTGTFPSRIVGLGGFKITLPDGVFDVESVESTSSLTLTSSYTGSGGTVSGTIHKFAQLRIYALSSFVPSGSSEVVQIGAPHSNDWFRRYAASVINDGEQNVLYLPEIVLPATTNSSNGFARYFVGIYGSSGQFIRQGPVAEFRLDSSTTPTSWAQILEFNSPPNPGPPQPENFYTAREIDARFPSGSAGQLLYFQSTGNVLTPLSLDPGDLQINGGVLETLNVTKQLQEEGSDLPIRNKINFVGSSFTATDDAGNGRTNIVADSDLNALASNSTNGFWARTGAGAGAARTLTGTANEIAIANGDGSGVPTFSLPAALTFSGKTVTGGAFSGPTITGGSHTALTGLGIRSTGSGAFDLILANTENLTAGRTLTFTVNDAARTVNLGGNLTTAGAFITSGANSLTLTTTGATNVTLPATGTLATLAGAETLTNKTLTSPRVGTSILDANGNELALLTATGSAVNEITLANAAAGGFPTLSTSGNDSNIDLTISPKGTGKVGIGTPGGSPVAGIVGGPNASGTNTAGVNLEVHGGKGTGNAVPGLLALRYPLTTSTGTTVQSLTTAFFPPWVSMFIRNDGDVTVSNTTTETSVLGAAQANSTKVIEAGLARVGRSFWIRLWGTLTTTGTPTLQFRLKLNSVTVADIGAVTLNNNTSTGSGGFYLESLITVRAVGASGTLHILPFRFNYNVTNPGAVVQACANAAAPTVDLTAAQTIDITAQWSAASASNSINIGHALIEMSR